MYFIVWTSFTDLNWNLISTSAKILKHSQGKLQCDSLFELMAWFRQTCLFFLLHLTPDPKKAFAAGLSPKKALKSECNFIHILEIPVIGKPFISSPPLSVVAKLGDPVALHCEAVGDPQPKVSFPSLGAYIVYNGVRTWWKSC